MMSSISEFSRSSGDANLPSEQLHVEATDKLSDVTTELCRTCRRRDFTELFDDHLPSHRQWQGKWISDRNADISENRTTFSLSPTCTVCCTLALMVPQLDDRPSSRHGNHPRKHVPETSKIWKDTYMLRAYSANAYFGVGPPQRYSRFDETPRVKNDGILISVLPSSMRTKAILNGRTYADSDSVKQALGVTGFLTLLDSTPSPLPYTGRRVSPEAVDWQVIRMWAQYCKKQHKDQCIVPRDNDFHQLKIKVIDCRTREVVELPPTALYTALSYVWGSEYTNEDTLLQNYLPKDCPAVIEDAICATMKLGYHFCWIDRYCIDHLNSDEKHHQITNMDSVYACASLTIIAAAGDDSNHGLPGVGRTPRRGQPHFRSGKVTVVSSLPNPKYDINQAKWSTRGWTYQEGLVSKRRLVFTDDQAYFQCSAMHCFESLNLPLDALHTQKEGRGMRFDERIRYGRIFPSVSLARRPMDFEARVNEFAKRSLSYENDHLNAFLGILRVFEKATYPVLHIHGVPLLPPECFNFKHESVNWIQIFAFGLMWFVNKGQRIAGLPSWSWVGWKCWDYFEIELSLSYRSRPWEKAQELLERDRIEKTRPKKDHLEQHRFDIYRWDTDLELGLEDETGHISWVSEKLFKMPEGRLLPRLHLKAFTATMHLVHGQDILESSEIKYRGEEWYKWLEIDYKIPFFNLVLYRDMPKEGLTLKAMLMFRSKRRFHFLLLESRGEAYERIGLAIFDRTSTNRFNFAKMPDGSANLGVVQLLKKNLCLV